MDRGQRIPKPEAPTLATLTRSPLQLQRQCACGSSAGPEGECETCGRETLQRKAESGSTPGGVAPPSVKKVLRMPGTPLDAATRAAMEPHFKHDFGKVRVHADGAAAESARAVRAAAYTVGRDVVFAAGQYAPESARGRQLIAHELTHVVQQSHNASTPATGAKLTVGPADGRAESEADHAAESMAAGKGSPVSAAPASSLQRAPDEWGPQYVKDHKSFLQKPYEEYKSGLGEIRPTTAGGLSENKGRPIFKPSAAATPAAPEITFDVLEEIFPLLKADAEAKPAIKKQAQEYLVNLNVAFKLMKIDTVEAQAFYLAHAFVESQQFRLLTEIGDDNPQHWDATGKTPDSNQAKKYFAKTYKKGGDVNPLGHAEFIGRGPVQVTHEPEYVEAIALLEKAAADYEKQPASDKEAAKFAKLARNAAAAIKKDPEQAANPEYTFLFSAAFLKGKGGDISSVNKTPDGAKWKGKDSVGGGDFAKGSAQDKALVVKGAAYKNIYCVLMREAKNSGVKQAEALHKKNCEGKAAPAAIPAGKSY